MNAGLRAAAAGLFAMGLTLGHAPAATPSAGAGPATTAPATHPATRDSAEGYTPFTFAALEGWLDELAANPAVLPTPSAGPVANPSGDPGRAKFIVGHTLGTAGHGKQWNRQDVPPLPIYAFQVTDPHAAGPKTRIILNGGNHPWEAPSIHVLRGMVDELLSDHAGMPELRQKIAVFVYPQCNPEGRWAAETRKDPGISWLAGNPEHPTGNHNRHWHDPQVTTRPSPDPKGDADPWTDIALVKAAMLKDTAGGELLLVMDFHMWGAVIGSPQAGWSSPGDKPEVPPWVKATQAYVPLDHGGPKPWQQPGALTVTALLPVRDGGLGARYGVTAEFAFVRNPPDDYVALGRAFMKGLRDIIATPPP